MGRPKGAKNKKTVEKIKRTRAAHPEGCKCFMCLKKIKPVSPEEKKDFNSQIETAEQPEVKKDLQHVPVYIEKEITPEVEKQIIEKFILGLEKNKVIYTFSEMELEMIFSKLEKIKGLLNANNYIDFQNKIISTALNQYLKLV